MTSYTTGYQTVRGAERRRDRRLPLPIFTVKLDGVTYQTMNWSLGGLLIEGYTGDRATRCRSTSRPRTTPPTSA
jgi:hypothetical protein